jgi:hypothetical protein
MYPRPAPRTLHLITWALITLIPLITTIVGSR